MADERQMLARFLRSGASEDFEPIVSQYINLVYSTALRVLPQQKAMAEDICQTVFADLSRKAARIPEQTPLAGWLYRHTCFVAANLNRSERRRLERERQAVEMNSKESAPKDVPDEDLHLAMSELGDRDRDALVLRFMDECDLRGVGERLGVSEDAAQKRVSRALDRLRQILQRRGISASVTGLTVSLGQPMVAAPAALTAKTVAAVAAGSGAVGSLPFIFEFMKTPVAKVAAILIISGGVAATIHHQGQLLDESQRENAELTSRLSAVEKAGREHTGLEALRSDARELKRLREQAREVHRLRAELSALKASRLEGRATPASSEDLNREGPVSVVGEEQSRVQILLEFKVVERSDEDDAIVPDELRALGTRGILEKEVFADLLSRLNESPGVDVLPAGLVVTIDGRQAQVQVGRKESVVSGYYATAEGEKNRLVKTNLFLGVQADLYPVIQSDGVGTQLKAKFRHTSLDGYLDDEIALPGKKAAGNLWYHETVPIVDIIEAEGAVIVNPGQTMMLRAVSKLSGEQNWMFVTASFINPAGNKTPPPGVEYIANRDKAVRVAE